MRISGGEPFLAAEQIKYLIEKIIAKHIHIRYVCIFTNGTRKEEGLILPFIELLDYLHSIENEASSLDKWSENNHMSVYNGTETSKLAIGRILYEDGATTRSRYGVNAEVLIGDIIIGNELHIKDNQGQDIMTVIDGRISTEVTEVKSAAASGTYEYYDPEKYYRGM